MPRDEDIKQQLDLLEIYRRTLASYLKRRAMLGEVNLTPDILHGIREARTEIKRIKESLRQWSIVVEDIPGDEPQSSEHLLVQPIRHTSPVTDTSLDQQAVLLQMQQQMSQGSRPIISIMGVKGGVGKTTLAARLAELVAETGVHVMLIDIDIETAGSTVLHRKRSWSATRRTIMTVYDHLRNVHSSGLTNTLSKPGPLHEPLEDVTPRYLRQPGFGNIYLLPARPLSSVKDRWAAVANIPPDTRNDFLLAELDRMIARADMVSSGPGVGCIIIDCGAEFNPLVSAAFHRADYGFIVGNPDPICLENIHTFDQEHVARFPDFRIDKIRIIVNRVQSETQQQIWYSVRRLAGFIPDDPELQQDWFNGELSFEYGYGNVSRSLVAILEKTVSYEHRQIVPNEIDVWIAPWWRLIKEYNLPAKMLDPTVDPGFKLGQDFRRVTLTSRLLLGIFLILMLLPLYFLFRPFNLVVPPATIVVAKLDSLEKVQQFQIELSTGADFFDVSKHLNVQTDVGLANDDSTIGQVSGLLECINKTEVGSVCTDILSESEKYYLIKVLERPTGPTLPEWEIIIRGLAFLTFLFLLWRVEVAWRLVRKQNKRILILGQLVDIAAQNKPAQLAVGLGQILPGGAGLDSEEHTLITKLIRDKELAEWLRSLLETQRIGRKLSVL